MSMLWTYGANLSKTLQKSRTSCARNGIERALGAVAGYHLVTKLPKELKGKLPSERQLLAAVKEAITEKV